MSVIPFIPKQDPDMPDNYGMTILYVNGKKEEFEMVQHHLNKEFGMMEFLTKEEGTSWVPLSSIQRLFFDKRLTKIMECKSKNDSRPKDEIDPIRA